MRARFTLADVTLGNKLAIESLVAHSPVCRSLTVRRCCAPVGSRPSSGPASAAPAQNMHEGAILPSRRLSLRTLCEGGWGSRLRGFTQPGRHGREERIDRRFIEDRVLTAPKSHRRIDHARVRPARASPGRTL